MKTAKDIIKEYLEANGFDGLATKNVVCFCPLERLMVCKNKNWADCHPARKRKPDPKAEPWFANRDFVLAPVKDINNDS